MPNTNPYAAGNNVYRGGSNVATMGQVDPMGYVNRELNNRRSQMAQGMLQKMGQGNSNNGHLYFMNPAHVSLLAIRGLGGP